MDDYQEVYKSICRVCLSHSAYQNMVSLIDTSTDDELSCYGKFVITFANIKLPIDHKLPVMMCKNCLLLLKQAIMFKYKCENSDMQLQNLMRINSTTNIDHKELICQYTIFKHYFPEECVPTRSISKSNGETKFSSDQDTDEIILKQNESEPKPSQPQENEDSNSDWSQDTLNDIPITQETHLETNFDGTNTDSDDELLNKLEKIINADMQNRKPTANKYRDKKLSKKVIKCIKRDFKCNVCNLQLSSRLRYDRHMQRHTGCRFMCEGCGKAFASKCELNAHQVAHHGIGLYLQCDQCSFKAVSKITLIEHIRLHTGERPYTCEKCRLTFRRKAIYRIHLLYHNEKKFQCSQCPKKFYRRCAMLAHKNNIHDRRYLYICTECGITYTQNVSVRRHLIKKHGIPREMQGKITKIRKHGIPREMQGKNTKIRKGSIKELPVK